MLKRYLKYKFLLFFGTLSFILGFVVLIGWYTKSVLLIQVSSKFVPMQYNTALGFLLSGLSIFFLFLKKELFSKVSALIVSLIGILTFIQYIFHIDLKIDQLFMEHYINVKTSHPGRMAPNTAICFFFNGLSIYVLSMKYNFIKKLKYSTTISTVVFSLGTIALFGYLSGIETTYGWGNLTRMAIHTSLGFIILGLAVIFNSLFYIINSKIRYSRWIILPISIGLITMTLVLWQAIYSKNSFSHVFVILTGFIFTFFISMLIHYFLQSKKSEQKLLLEIENRKLIENELNSYKIHLEDIIAKRTVELEKEKQNAIKLKIEAENSNNAKNKFFSIIAHDLRSPIGSAITLLEYLERKFYKLDKERLKEKIRSLTYNSKKLYELLENLLEWSKSQTGLIQSNVIKSDILNIALIEKEILKEKLSEKEIDLIINIDKNHIAYFDFAMLQVIIRNIISNAIKFTHRKGEIIISSHYKDDFLILDIKDDGIGISEENIKKVFDIKSKFVGIGTEKEKGSGLGLLLCNEFILKMDGKIEVQSKLGKGTTFSIYLPAIAVSD